MLSQQGLNVLLGNLHGHLTKPRPLAVGGQTLTLPHWPSVKAILGVLRNVAQKPRFQRMLREANAVIAVREVTADMIEKYLVSTIKLFNCINMLIICYSTV